MTVQLIFTFQLIMYSMTGTNVKEKYYKKTLATENYETVGTKL